MCIQEVRNSSYIARKWISRTASCKNHTKSVEYSKLENSDNDDFDYYYDVSDGEGDGSEEETKQTNIHGSMISI